MCNEPPMQNRKQVAKIDASRGVESDARSTKWLAAVHGLLQSNNVRDGYS
jgi:hypothetical protein